MATCVLRVQDSVRCDVANVLMRRAVATFAGGVSWVCKRVLSGMFRRYFFGLWCIGVGVIVMDG